MEVWLQRIVYGEGNYIEGEKGMRRKVVIYVITTRAVYVYHGCGSEMNSYTWYVSVDQKPSMTATRTPFLLPFRFAWAMLIINRLSPNV